MFCVGLICRISPVDSNGWLFCAGLIRAAGLTGAYHQWAGQHTGERCVQIGVFEAETHFQQTLWLRALTSKHHIGYLAKC